MTDAHVVLSGSERPRKQDAERVGDVNPSAAVEVTVTLRGPELPEVSPGHSMSREELERAYASSTEDMDAVAAALQGYGLEELDRMPSARSMRVRGTAAQMDAAFRADLGVYRRANGVEFRGREGELQIPGRLNEVVTGVFGLDQRRVARRAPGIPPYQGTAAEVAQAALTPSDLEERYRFPAGDAARQTVAIAEFGGAYFAGDLAKFCREQGRPEPTVRQVGLGVPVLTEEQVMALAPAEREQVMEAAGEVNMDVQIVAGLCPAAEIIVYFTQFDQKGWVDLLNEIIKGVPAAPVAVSVSWGLAEDSADFSAAARSAIDERLQAAALLGVTVCVSAGDDSRDRDAARSLCAGPAESTADEEPGHGGDDDPPGRCHRGAEREARENRRRAGPQDAVHHGGRPGDPGCGNRDRVAVDPGLGADVVPRRRLRAPVADRWCLVDPGHRVAPGDVPGVLRSGARVVPALRRVHRVAAR